MSHSCAVRLPQVSLEVLLECLIENTALSVLESELASEGLSSVLAVEALAGCLALFFTAFVFIIITSVLYR
jgi:hypothetical protein